MRMYVVIAVCAVIVTCLLLAADRAAKAIRRGRRRRDANARLSAVAAKVDEKERQKTAAKEASKALTSVLPAIADRGPRRVA